MYLEFTEVSMEMKVGKFVLIVPLYEYIAVETSCDSPPIMNGTTKFSFEEVMCPLRFAIGVSVLLSCFSITETMYSYSVPTVMLCSRLFRVLLTYTSYLGEPLMIMWYSREEL